MKYNLLFVDDEEQILDGIQDSLRKFRKQWNMTFVCGGEAAIVELEIKSFDVIICDMRMPLVDGVDVLKYAKKHNPATIRIVLSGYSELAPTIAVSSLAHRYLTKPCDQVELEMVIQRCMEVSGKLNNPVVKEIAGNVGQLPVGDSQYQRLLDVLQREDASITDIARIIESDISLTSKLLHLVNSAFFRRKRMIESAKEAANYLGTDLIRAMVLANQFFTVAQSKSSVDKAKVSALQEHSWLTASIAKCIMQDTEYEEAAFTAALLHKVGDLALGAERPDLLIEKSSTHDSGPGDNKEFDSHADLDTALQDEIGAYLLNLWGMPFTIVEAVTFHNRPLSREYHSLDVVGAVYVAGYLATVCTTANAEEIQFDAQVCKYLESLNIQDRLEGWFHSAKEIAAESAAGNPFTDVSRVA